jgi:hypothetical protein
VSDRLSHRLPRPRSAADRLCRRPAPVGAGEPGSRAARRAACWIEQRPDGLAIRLAFSKTDQEPQGDVVGVPYASSEDLCPVRAYRA